MKNIIVTMAALLILFAGFTVPVYALSDAQSVAIQKLLDDACREDGTGGKIGDYEKRVIEYTDYRTYLFFDLEVTHKDGTSERLSKTLSKKSGGETQTPFYIAVLASFAQLYRIGRDKSEKTSRLIIFDEAFSKMDGERIVRSIELLRKFKFQVILSAPPDKIGDIATLVDRNLLVYREGKSTCVKEFDPRQIEDIVYD
ncbi:SbcC/MukB-like Walker B domain-containing protein [Hydrogenoanaerobacterium sp.]|uniref:SbcC/MukB-like Walker B domain-containing protein n=1 Tax=Hydrogenoanaerobacterium sp. TaxID=2953763 RepID=UPI00289EF10B|nr:SbcC/MukB-like Walker B domain-containing protein [Hydrogenoanaerobacterium sp.]